MSSSESDFVGPPASPAHGLRTPSRIPLIPFGAGLSAFLAISYALCILLGLINNNWGLHQPWLQFLPGFTWLTWPSFFLGLVEVIGYGWYTALVFGPLYNFFVVRWR